MLELLGWISSTCFAICALPQAVTCYKQGHGKGLSKAFMWIWLTGEAFGIPYFMLKFSWDGPIMVNYIANTCFILFIMRYIYFPRGTNASI